MCRPAPLSCSVELLRPYLEWRAWTTQTQKAVSFPDTDSPSPQPDSQETGTRLIFNLLLVSGTTTNRPHSAASPEATAITPRLLVRGREENTVCQGGTAPHSGSLTESTYLNLENAFLECDNWVHKEDHTQYEIKINRTHTYKKTLSSVYKRALPLTQVLTISPDEPLPDLLHLTRLRGSEAATGATAIVLLKRELIRMREGIISPVMWKERGKNSSG